MPRMLTLLLQPPSNPVVQSPRAGEHGVAVTCSADHLVAGELEAAAVVVAVVVAVVGTMYQVAVGVAEVPTAGILDSEVWTGAMAAEVSAKA